METHREFPRRLAPQVASEPRRSRILLVDGDLGRRATLGVALGAKYIVDAVPNALEAHARALINTFDIAVLDSAVLEASLPRLVRFLRARSRDIRLVIVSGRRDLRGRHYAATLGFDAKVGRSAPAYALLDRIRAFSRGPEGETRFDRVVARAIDLMARDVTHLLHVSALAYATGVALPDLTERFRSETGLSVHEYVTRVRVAVAEQLLRDTDLDMGTLAELLGFADAADLARAAAGSRQAP
jgi:AraC-like DNA-binding protein